MSNDIEDGIATIRNRSKGPLHCSLVDMQRAADPYLGKTSDLRCMKANRNRRGAFHPSDRVELHYVHTSKYIAVSCPWELTSPDDKVITSKYSVIQTQGMQKTIPPQDVVLDRVIRFARLERLPFWIDRLCIEQQEGSEEKAVAIKSMDIVYGRSQLTVGLLFIRIDSEHQVAWLHQLLSDNCSSQVTDRSGQTSHQLTITPSQARAVMDVVEMILQDNWWKRGWIYQEEYLSGGRMLLLIRCSPWPKLDTVTFGSIPGELQLNASDFRNAVTAFCLAFQDHTGVSAADRDRCREVLHIAGWYNLLLAQDKYRGVEPMSATILRELGKRKLTNMIDILAIAANACSYSIRIDPESLPASGGSLALATLSLYILNGEILRPCSASKRLSNRTVFQLLSQLALKVRLPLKGGRLALTFAKHCRYPHVTICHEGLRTRGIIWKLSRQVKPITTWTNFHLPRDILRRIQAYRPCDKKRRFLSSKEHEALWFLYCRVKRYSGSFAARLSDFLLKCVPRGYTENWEWEHFLHLMAISVAHAFKDGCHLRLGSVWRGKRHSPYTAIFIEDEVRTREAEAYFAFTAWARATECTQGGRLASSSISKYVSVEIDHCVRSNGCPEITPQKWLNGLCFFENADAMEAVIPWPPCFLEEALEV